MNWNHLVKQIGRMTKDQKASEVTVAVVDLQIGVQFLPILDLKTDGDECGIPDLKKPYLKTG